MERERPLYDLFDEIEVTGADIQLHAPPGGGICGAAQLRLLAPSGHVQSYPSHRMIETEQMVLGRRPFINKRIEDENSKIPLIPIGKCGFGLGYELLRYHPGTGVPGFNAVTSSHLIRAPPACISNAFRSKIAAVENRATRETAWPQSRVRIGTP